MIIVDERIKTTFSYCTMFKNLIWPQLIQTFSDATSIHIPLLTSSILNEHRQLNLHRFPILCFIHKYVSKSQTNIYPLPPTTKKDTHSEKKEKSENIPLCVNRIPNLRLSVILCLEYLSSGENLAGWADFVTWPSLIFLRVYSRLPEASRVYIRCMFL